MLDDRSLVLNEFPVNPCDFNFAQIIMMQPRFFPNAIGTEALKGKREFFKISYVRHTNWYV